MVADVLVANDLVEDTDLGPITFLPGIFVFKLFLPKKRFAEQNLSEADEGASSSLNHYRLVLLNKNPSTFPQLNESDPISRIAYLGGVWLTMALVTTTLGNNYLVAVCPGKPALRLGGVYLIYPPRVKPGLLS